MGDDETTTVDRQTVIELTEAVTPVLVGKFKGTLRTILRHDRSEELVRRPNPDSAIDVDITVTGRAWLQRMMAENPRGWSQPQSRSRTGKKSSGP